MTRPRKHSERRSDLVAAAQRAMVEHGAGTVRLHQIAAEAGLTSGAVLYHFPDLEELLLEANHAGMERFYEQRVRALEGIDDPVRCLVTTIRSGLPEGPDDMDVRLLCELGGAAGRNRVLGALLTTLYDRQTSLYQVILEHGAARGTFRLADSSLGISRTLVALEDAFGYRIVARHPTIDRAAAEVILLDYARMATGNALDVTETSRQSAARDRWGRTRVRRRQTRRSGRASTRPDKDPDSAPAT